MDSPNIFGWRSATAARLATRRLTGTLAPIGRPTAILANNDYAAVILMSRAQSSGLSIPGDLSVVGYDNSFLARTEYIGLTTVDNNYADIGRYAARQLARRIETPNAARSVNELARSDTVDRQNFSTHLASIASGKKRHMTNSALERAAMATVREGPGHFDLKNDGAGSDTRCRWR